MATALTTILDARDAQIAALVKAPAPKLFQSDEQRAADDKARADYIAARAAIIESADQQIQALAAAGDSAAMGFLSAPTYED